MNLTRSSRITFAVLLTVGAVFLGLMLFTAGQSLELLHKSARAQARYTGAESHGGANAGVYLFPTFVFRTAEGQEVSFTSKNGSTGTEYTEGQMVPILYDPQNPAKATVNSFADVWLAPAILSLFVLGFLILPLLLLRGALRK